MELEFSLSELNKKIPRVHFNKTYKNPEELVKLLLSRGLIINDAKRTERYIRSIGYYRLSAYFHPFLKSPKIEHKFKDGTTFDSALMLYRFDKKFMLPPLSCLE